MTTNVDVVNRALQVIGTRTTVTTLELANNTTNEAIQANLILEKYRDQLLRMAPWNCGIRYTNLWYITSVPGTPENTSPATNLWTPGQPAPPWAYEYFYPTDCLRMCWLIPSTQTGFANGVPITTAVTGGAPVFWQGQPVKYKVSTDTFRQATTHTLVSGGSGYQVGEIVTLGGKPSIQGEVPAGLVQIQVLTVDGTGSILTYSLYTSDVIGKTGFFFAVPTYPLDQVYTTGFGTGAQLSVTGVDLNTFAYRTILTNEEYATCAYVRRVTDPNAMDDDFIEAWATVLASGLAIALTGDKPLANMAVGLANKKIELARQQDGNEGLTVNDVTPDFIRIRGIAWTEYYNNGPWSGFDWGGLWSSY